MSKIYPIGIQTFDKIIEGGFQYIDKTKYVYDIAQKYQYVFMSRPRRFGKSLLTSTFHSYFEGRKELFEGLEVSRLEKEWTKYPVLHFDMSEAKNVDAAQLGDILDAQLSRYEEIYGKRENVKDYNLRLAELIRRAYEQTGKKTVVLIDEYDAPLFDVMVDEKKFKANRYMMENFYSPLKACDTYQRFVMITGVTRFPVSDICSCLNNLHDISMQPDYAAICGITDEELQTQLSETIDDFAVKIGVSRDEALAKLKEYYGGYGFSGNSPELYNPYSLIHALNDGKLESYLFSSSTPQYMIEQIRKYDAKKEKICPIEIIKHGFYVPLEGMYDILPLLYQCGYITIKDYDPICTAYTLDIPNREVRDKFPVK